MFYNLPQVPLIDRIKMGPQYCSPEEWEAYVWLLWKWRSFVRNYDGSWTPFVEERREESRAFGVISLEVPFRGNPQRPWIVNELMCQSGAQVKQYGLHEQITFEGRFPVSIEFTYKTNEVGFVNNHYR